MWKAAVISLFMALMGVEVSRGLSFAFAPSTEECAERFCSFFLIFAVKKAAIHFGFCETLICDFHECNEL